MSAAALAAELGPATALMIDAICELESVHNYIHDVGESGPGHDELDQWGNSCDSETDDYRHIQRAWLLIFEAAECLAAADERGRDIRSDGPKDCSAAVLRAAEDYGRALRAAHAARGGKDAAAHAKALEAVAAALEALRAALGIDA